MLETQNYPEFTVKKLYEMFAADELVMLHLPDPAAQSRPVDRTWAYRVVNSIRGEYMSKVFEHARKKRLTEVPVRANYVQAEILPELRALLLA
jgi:hypothetical protein